MLILYLAISTYLAGFLFCANKVRSLKKSGYSEMKCKDCLNPVKWFSFVYGIAFKYLIPQHVMEQMLLRYFDDFCRPNCYEGNGGKCVHCGCDAIAKANVPFETCSGAKWGPLIFNKKKYKEHREKYPIKIKIEYGEL